jgi:uncharacterized membrane protein YdjX (TVP38/TMEM64 family)
MRLRDRLLAALALLFMVALVGLSYWSGGLAWLVLSPAIDGADKVRGIQRYFESWGTGAPLVYVAFVIVEVVVAPLPGTGFYLPGGLLFGWVIGGLASLAGNVLGAGICVILARTLGRPYVKRLIPEQSLARYDTVLARHGVWVILLLRVNPLTSSDLVSYAAGLASMSAWRVMLGTLLGMAPMSFVQAYFAEEVFTRFPFLLYPLAAAGMLYLLAAVWILMRLRATVLSRPRNG